MQSAAQSRDEWVLCRIFLKKRSAKNNDPTVLGYNNNNRNNIKGSKVTRCRNIKDNKDDNDNNNVELVFYDFMARKETTDSNPRPTSPDSSSSGITELSIFGAGNDRETSSNLNTSSNSSFSCFRTQS